jgi:hypothetical protein
MEGRIIDSYPSVEKGFRRRAVERFRARDRQPFFGNVTALVVARLAEVNRRRTSRVLTFGQVITLVRKAVASAEEAGVRHGVVEWYEPAEVSGWNYHDARTTLAMAAWVDGRLWLSLKECPAWSEGPPGRAVPGRRSRDENRPAGARRGSSSAA